MRGLQIAAAIAMLGTCAAADAHVSLEPRSAAAGAYQKLVFRVGHGCEGSATTAITVVLPEGLGEAKAMPKPGWSLSTAGREISWKGGPLPDSQFDEFSLLMKLPAAPGRQLFKVLQQCEKGRAEWSEGPGGAGKFPAPLLDIVAPGAASSPQPGSPQPVMPSVPAGPAVPPMPAMPAGHQH